MTSNRPETIDRLSELLHRTSEDHHVAFKATDGVDADWSVWYADHLLELGVEKLLDATLLKSDIIYLLVGLDKRINVEAPGARWERWYASELVARYLR
jgi:hypothetical protein